MLRLFLLQIEKKGVSSPHAFNSQPVTALAVSISAFLLVVGTSSGQIHVYDIASHQHLRSINTYKDKGLSITSLATLLKPPDLFGHVTLGDGGPVARDAGPVRPVAPFQRTKDASARETHEVPMMLPVQDSVRHTPALSWYHVAASAEVFQFPKAPFPLTEELLREQRYFVQTSSKAASNGTSMQSRVSELEVEVTSLREQLEKAKGLNDAMWEGIVQKVLDQDCPANDVTDMELGERRRKRSRIAE